MPGAVGANFNGLYIVRPGVYPTNDTRAMGVTRPGPNNTILVAGPSDGGVAGAIYEFGSFDQARQVLRGGDTLGFIARMFRASGDQPGAQLVRWVRVGAPTLSTLTAAGVVFSSRDSGRHTNGISLQIATGTAAGSFDVTVRKRGDAYQRVYNVGLGLSLTTTATGACKVIFDHVNRQASLQEAGATVMTFTYPTDGISIAQLASWINGRAGWTALVAGDPSMPVSAMDNPLAASAPAVTAAATSLPAGQGQLAWLINVRDPLVTCVLSTPATLGPVTVVAETGFANGTGMGLDVVATSDYTTALSLLEGVDGQYLFLASSDPAVQSLGNQHCIEMNKLTRKRWRIFVTGGPAFETAANARLRAAALDGPTTYVWNGTVITDPVTGLPKQCGGLGSAAQVCGMCGGLPDAEPLTNKAISSEGLETPVVSDTVLDSLLVAGVTPIYLDPIQGGTRILQALTTYQSGPNPMFRKLQGLRIQYHLTRGEQTVLAEFVGVPMDLVEGNRLKARMGSYLNAEIRGSRNPDGVLTVSSDDGKAWKNLTVVGDGIDVWRVDADMHPVGESAYVLVTNHLSPAKLSF